MKAKCIKCGEMVDDANILVDDDKYRKEHKIEQFTIVCKPCTRKFDPKHTLHNIWELQWIDRSPLHLLGYILGRLVNGKPEQLSSQAVNDFLARDPLQHGQFR